jgi:transcriptional regulator with XRE-family HTH domain
MASGSVRRVTASRGTAGPLVRQRRKAARLSQLDLALEVGISPRHLSFVELGKSRPSPALLLTLAEYLNLPLRERNEWLLAAGYAPRYPQRPLDAPALARIRASLHQVLDAHDPFPAVAIDRSWDIQMANMSALRLRAALPDHVSGPVPNLFRMALHPDGFAGRSPNFADWSPYLLRNLALTLARHGSPALGALAEEAEGWPGLPPRSTWSHAPAGEVTAPVMTWKISTGGHELSFFTIMSMLGTPLDVTLAELTLELFFPADAATQEFLEAQAGGSGRPAMRPPDPARADGGGRPAPAGR